MNPLSLQVEYFKRAYAAWRAGVAHVRVQYISIRVENVWVLLTARVHLDPFELTEDHYDVVSTKDLCVGNAKKSFSVDELDEFMERLYKGRLSLFEIDLSLPSDMDLSVYAHVPLNEPEYYSHQLEVKCSQTNVTQTFDYLQANAELRCGQVPFDGLVDLLSFFDFGNAGHLPHEHSILLTLHPPGDLMFDGCTLSQNMLKLKIVRRTTFTRDAVALGLRQFPNPSMARRSQISSQIVWHEQARGFETGWVNLTSLYTTR
jgi:hypothetical protein